MANFVEIEWETKMQHGNMVMNVSDCSNDSHDCCFSPFENWLNETSSINSWNNYNKKIKGKIFDYSFLAILQEGFEINYINKLNSPPREVSNIENRNIYINLTWIIKNNN